MASTPTDTRANTTYSIIVLFRSGKGSVSLIYDKERGLTVLDASALALSASLLISSTLALGIFNVLERPSTSSLVAVIPASRIVAAAESNVFDNPCVITPTSSPE